MAVPMKGTSFLPSIKCSSCNASIEISSMGDHVCAQVPSMPESQTSKLNNPVPLMNPILSKGYGYPRQGKMLPPRIDPSAANRPFRRHDQLIPNSMSSIPHSPSPLSPMGGRKSPYRMPPRSVTSPLPRRPPSPDYTLPQDCAFPPFPPAKSRSTTPKTPSEPRSSFESGPTKGTAELPDGRMAPKSRTNSGEQVVQRLQTIAPGPFNVRSQEGKEWNSPHKRTTTTSSSKETILAPNTYSAKNSLPRPSTADSNHKRMNSLSSISGGPKSGIIRSKTVSTESPSDPTSSKLSRQNQVEEVPPMPTPSHNATLMSFRQDIRSQTSPFDMNTGLKVDGSTDLRSNGTTENLDFSHVRKPSVASINRPLEEIGSTTSYRPYRPNQSRAGSPAKQQTMAVKSSPPSAFDRSGDRRNKNLNLLTSISVPAQSNDYNAAGLYHTPTESTSSRESSGSDANSHSSRSSPPLSESAYHPRRKASDTNRIENLMNDIQATISDVTVKEEPPQPQRIAPPSFSRPIYPRSINPTPRLEAVIQSPESPMDPAMRGDRHSPLQSPIDRSLSPQPLQNASIKAGTSLSKPSLQNSNAHVPPVLERTPALPVQPPPASSHVRRTTTMNKGKCRGCNELITGKSVSSADGRLTGRYHKHCFVCKTCKEPFQTADFYVISNHPYCSRHYHQLNGSLCKTCDRGIEGQYVETELKQKFHPSCFTCQNCRRILEDDYFEMNGGIYCEQHAFTAAQESSFLGSGRRHPERRTTRLMMM